MAERGFRVWAGVRSPESATELHNEAESRRTALQTVILDITDKNSVEQAVATVVDQAGGLYGLVNNAGVSRRCYFEEFPEETVREIFEVNVFGTMRVTQCALPHLRKGGSGRVVILTSIGGRIGTMALAPYIATKFALEGFGESLFLEMRPFGTRVVIIEPGIIRTSIWDKSRRVLPPAARKDSPYYDLFWRAEVEADKLVNTSRLQPRDVARAVVKAMTAAKPRLRYTVGRRAGLVLSLRKHLPDWLFEEVYFGELLRRVTRNPGHAGQ